MASTPPMNGGLWKRVVRCASTEGQEVGPRGRSSKRVIHALAEKVAVGQHGDDRLFAEMGQPFVPGLSIRDTPPHRTRAVSSFDGSCLGLMRLTPF
jgi:hypothetical protein